MMHAVPVLCQELAEGAVPADRLVQLKHKAVHGDNRHQQVAGNRFAPVGIVLPAFQVGFADLRLLHAENLRPLLSCLFNILHDNADLDKSVFVHCLAHCSVSFPLMR